MPRDAPIEAELAITSKNAKALDSQIANLASGIGVVKVSNGRKEFWRVRLGRRFTGGEVQTKHFNLRNSFATSFKVAGVGFEPTTFTI